MFCDTDWALETDILYDKDGVAVTGLDGNLMNIHAPGVYAGPPDLSARTGNGEGKQSVLISLDRFLLYPSPTLL
jgi:hypothetical protein